jgi:hypothetical protein
MGPWSEQKQLERLHAVRSILQRNDLSEWARNYWGIVFDTIARTEERYNSRVVGLYANRKKKDIIEYE